jgi:hypothetical protein
MNNNPTQIKGSMIGGGGLVQRTLVADVASRLDGIDNEARLGEQHANARLIAVAPELLAFVRECALDRDDRVSGGMRVKAKLLLAKAEGRA